MEFIFWSAIRYGGGVTTNLLAIAIVCSSYYGVKVGLRSNHFSNRMIERYYSVTSEIGRIADKGEFFSGQNSPDYLRYLYRYRERFDKKIFRGQQNTYKNAGLTLYSPPELNENPFPANTEDELFFLDASGENSLSTYKALESADIMVIFLPCDLEAALNCVEKYPSYIDKAYFIVNKGSRKTGFPMAEFLRKTGILPEKIMVIPYCEALMSACARGDVDIMIKRLAEDPEQAEYVRRIKYIARKFIMLSGAKIRKGCKKDI